MYLTEDSELYKGIFWVVNEDNIYSNSNYCFKIPSDIHGNSTDGTLNLNAKSGSTYNHRLVWRGLSRKQTKGKPYNYFPRGRVEIQDNSKHYLCHLDDGWIEEK